MILDGIVVLCRKLQREEMLFKMSYQPSSKQNNVKQSSSRKPGIITRFKGLISSLAIFAFFVAGIGVVIYQQADLVEQREQTEIMQDQLYDIQAQNDELNRILNSDNEQEYMERIAIERLGYAYPGERRFYVMNTTP